MQSSKRRRSQSAKRVHCAIELGPRSSTKSLSFLIEVEAQTYFIPERNVVSQTREEAGFGNSEEDSYQAEAGQVLSEGDESADNSPADYLERDCSMKKSVCLHR